MQRIIAVDPGQHTGLAIFRDEEVEGVFLIDGIRGLIATFKAYPPTVVIVENFHRQKVATGPQTDTLKMIGAIETLALEHKAEIVTQSPTDRKAWEKEASAHPAVQAMNAVARPHVRDAVAHGLRYLALRKSN